MFTKQDGQHFTIIVAYVDDLLLTGSDLPIIQLIKQALDSAFTIKDLGELTYFLGIEVSRSPAGILLNQRKYIVDMLKDTKLEFCKTTAFPFPKALKLNAHDGERLEDPEIYRRLVGKFLYLNMTRPDISYVVQQLSQFLSDPRTPHLNDAMYVIRYLKGTIDHGLLYDHNDLQLQAYSDADWGNCPVSGRSLIGYCIFLGNSFIYWKTKKQKVASKSSAEAGYRSMSHTTSEVVWPEGPLQDLKVLVHQPITLFCDNTSAQHIAENHVLHERTKHIKLDVHYVRENVQSSFLKLQHVSSGLQ
ncbi:uncharacterized mitochondrial protein AtMg00810-like [Beta vulgaris subsp. vulgaris]|uniref:uncharacterized mitochondrial protein AtMg00810-like n=1 Tax=Beta vulgaris subsp. vulgaris TaxID=3555 RepID=UPI0009010EEE|nr:uncharacterized mitochondrial protein AtMg00810-like [Beta vulgaris subsp. vulgaris]